MLNEKFIEKYKSVKSLSKLYIVDLNDLNPETFFEDLDLIVKTKPNKVNILSSFQNSIIESLLNKRDFREEFEDKLELFKNQISFSFEIKRDKYDPEPQEYHNNPISYENFMNILFQYFEELKE